VLEPVGQVRDQGEVGGTARLQVLRAARDAGAGYRQTGRDQKPRILSARIR